MQAASALLANAIAAPGGDGAAAPDAAGGADAFTSALAALMGVTGQAQPAANDPPAPSSLGAVASGSQQAVAFNPAAAPSADAATSSAATAPLGGLGGGVVADALQALDAVISDLEAAPKAAQSTDGSASAGSMTTNATAATASGDAATPTDLAEDPLLALLNDTADETNADAPPPSANVAEKTAAPCGAAPVPAPSATVLDPRLIRFVARASLASESDAPATDGPPAAPAASANASTPADGLPDPQTAAAGIDDEIPPAPANPVTAGLILFSPAAAQPAAPPQPLAAARPNPAKTAASNASPSLIAAKPASLLDIGRAGLAALGAARDDPDADTTVVTDNAGQPSADGQGEDDPSSGPLPAPAAFQLAQAAAPTAAAVAAPPAAAALAQAHVADITAQLAAQIAGRAGAVKSSFNFSLEPQGLGRVDVSLKIDPQGGLSAILSFDNPAVAAEARSRAGDLQQALQQAGFDVSQSGLSFTAGGQGHGAAFQAASQPSYAPAQSLAETAAPELAAISATLAARRAAGGLDITI